MMMAFIVKIVQYSKTMRKFCGELFFKNMPVYGRALANNINDTNLGPDTLLD